MLPQTYVMGTGFRHHPLIATKLLRSWLLADVEKSTQRSEWWADLEVLPSAEFAQHMIVRDLSSHQEFEFGYRRALQVFAEPQLGLPRYVEPPKYRAAAAGADHPAGRDAARESSGPGAAAGGGIAGTLGNLLDSLTGGQVASRKGEPGLGDKLGNYFDPGSAEPAGETAAPPEAARQPMDDGRALLLIRAMIAAANADGRISDEERRRVLAAVDEADGDAGDHRLIEHELLDPKPLDSLLAEVGDHDTARQLYAVSRAAMDGETLTQIAYLDYLRNRLGLPPDETAEIDEAMQ